MLLGQNERGFKAQSACLPVTRPKNVHVCKEAALAGEAFESFTAKTRLAMSVSTQHPKMTPYIRLRVPVTISDSSAHLRQA